MMRVCILLGLSVYSAQAACVPSETNLCMKINPFAGESGLYEFGGKTGASPDIIVKINETYTFDQTDATNWYHPVGFAYYPDGAHGDTWGGEERAEIETKGELLYKIDGAATTCAAAGDTGLDCYEPEFFLPRGDVWMKKKYTAELTITQAMADASQGGVIYYFCHIHSKMSGQIIIQNADGSAVTQADGSALDNATAQTLYPKPTISTFDASCGTVGVKEYTTGGANVCATSEKYLPGTLDTTFEKCLDAINCQMNKEMRIAGYDTHADPIVTFMQQMIPHHANAVSMSKILLKHNKTEVQAVEDFEGVLWDIMNQQSYQIHQFRNYLGSHTGYNAVSVDGKALSASSVGHHCDNTHSAAVEIANGTVTPAATAAVTGCVASATNLCMTVNAHTGETGYYEFAGKTGPSPNITVKIGETYVFDQRDATNWYHPVGFAYYPDGAHGDKWGGAERAEVETKGELLYKIDGAKTTCAKAGDTGLDCYEPEFFYPRGDWMAKKYSAELTITQAMADASYGGVIYYFCHIHSKMSGRIIIQNADGTAVTQANKSALPKKDQLALYKPVTAEGVDVTCGTVGAHLGHYVGSGPKKCSERFLCGTLNTDFEKCLQAVDCQMNKEMHSQTTKDLSDKVATFMQQMIPHHLNAIYMAKILMKTVSAAKITAAMKEDGLTNILHNIISVQGHQVHFFRNYLEPKAYLHKAAGGYLHQHQQSVAGCYDTKAHKVTCQKAGATMATCAKPSMWLKESKSCGFVASVKGCYNMTTYTVTCEKDGATMAACAKPSMWLNESKSCGFVDSTANSTGNSTGSANSTGGAKPAANSTGAGTLATVSGVFEISMSDPSAVLGNAAAKTAFESSLAVEIASAAGSAITAAHVAVTVSAASSRRLNDARRLAGALSVAYTITVPASASKATVAQNFNAKTTTELTALVNSALTEAAKTVPALASVKATGVTVKTTATASGSSSASSSGTTAGTEPAASKGVMTTCTSVWAQAFVPVVSLVGIISL